MQLPIMTGVVALLLLALILITYVPDLSLGLVRLLGYAALPLPRH